MGSDRATIVVVRCSMLPDGPPQEKDSIGINTTGFLFLAVVLSFWIAHVDRCRTDSTTHAMPRLASVGASSGKDTVGAATEVI